MQVDSHIMHQVDTKTHTLAIHGLLESSAVGIIQRCADVYIVIQVRGSTVTG